MQRLTVENLRRAGLEVPALTLGRGECVTLMGPSGAGKSLLLRAIADLDPNDGEVYLDGRSRRSIPAPEWRTAVTYVAGESAWWSDIVRDHFRDPNAVRSRLKSLKLSDDSLAWTIRRLSSGERQRLALLRALEHEPDVLLLDEPTSALDSDAVASVEALLAAERRERGVALLWVTHDAAQAERVGDRHFRMMNGRLVMADSAPD